MLKVILPDGSSKEFPGSVPVKDVAAAIGPRLLKAAIAAEVDGKVVGLDYKLPAEGEVKVRILTKKDPEALGVMRHSAAHIMARAVMRLKKGVQLAFGPTVEGGFYYDFELPEPLKEEDFPAIEAEMKKIIELDEPFERIEEPRGEGAGDLRRPGAEVQGRAHQHGPGRSRVDVVLSAGRVHRPLPRAARAQPQGRSGRTSCCRSPGPIGKATPATPSCSGCMPRRSSRRRSWKSI